jgi:hypothetical protein
MKKLTIFIAIGIVALFILLIILLSLLNNTIMELNPTWNRQREDEDDSIGRSIVEYDGFLYTIGYSRMEDSSIVVLLQKYNSDGRLIWERTWGRGDYNIGYGIVCYNNSLYIVGTTRSVGTSGNEILLLNSDTDGNFLWNKTVKYGRRNWAVDITECNGYIYILADVYWSYRNDGMILLKLNLNGDIIREDTWSEGDISHAYAITSYDDNIYILGSTTIVGSGEIHEVLLKYDKDGNLNWTRKWSVGGFSGDSSKGLFGYNNAIYVASSTKLYDGDRVYLAKYDTQGVLKWDRIWTEEANFRESHGEGICVYDNTLYVIGTTQINSTADQDILLLNYDLKGNLKWAKTWNEPGNEQSSDIICSKGFLYITGRSSEQGSDNDELFIMKVDTSEIPPYWGVIIIMFGIILVIILDTILIQKRKKNQNDDETFNKKVEEQHITLKKMNVENDEGPETIEPVEK